MFSEAFLRRQVDKSRYEIFLKEELVDALIVYGASDNIGAGVFQRAVSDDVLKADIYKQISLMYENSDKGVDEGLVRQNFQTALYEAVSNGGDLTAEQKSAADSLADKAAAEYVNTVSIPFVDMIHDILNEVKTVNYTGIAGFAAISLALALILLFAAKHRISRRRRAEYLMNAVAASALILGVPSGYLYFSGWLKKLPIPDGALYALSQQYIYSALQIIVLFIIILAVVFVCCFLYRRAYINSRKNGRRFTLLTHM